ncbi:hypothetical protein PSPO01_01388 [Paraphaeosphaeria sporulosa]
MGISRVHEGKGQAAGVRPCRYYCGEPGQSLRKLELAQLRGRPAVGPGCGKWFDRCGRFRKGSDPALAVYLSGNTRWRRQPSLCIATFSRRILHAQPSVQTPRLLSGPKPTLSERHLEKSRRATTPSYLPTPSSSRPSLTLSPPSIALTAPSL